MFFRILNDPVLFQRSRSMSAITSISGQGRRSQRIHPYAAFRETVGDPVQVVCPRCGDRGRVYPLRFARNVYETGGLYLCDSCELAITGFDPVATFLQDDDRAPLDAVFRLPLWMQTPCCGHLLWAFNLRHLQLLIEAVGQPLAEGVPGSGVSAVAEFGRAACQTMELMRLTGLPAWVRAAEHRAAVIVSLNRLKALGSLASDVRGRRQGRDTPGG